VVQAFAPLLIDYCNSLLYDISVYNINHQEIQNRSPWIVTNTREYDHIAPNSSKAWLPVRERIHFKILLITHKSINDMAPEYLCEVVSSRKSSRKLRSSGQILLQVAMSRLKTYVPLELQFYRCSKIPIISIGLHLCSLSQSNNLIHTN